MTVPEPAKDHVIQRSTVDPESRCWVWQRKLNRGGYAQTSRDGRTVTGHRVAYIAWRGELPEGTEIDHLCKNKACVNPWHLEPVPHQENMRRAYVDKPRKPARPYEPRGRPLVYGEHTRQFGLRLPESLLKELDERRGEESRAALIVRALRKHLDSL